MRFQVRTATSNSISVQQRLELMCPNRSVPEMHFNCCCNVKLLRKQSLVNFVSGLSADHSRPIPDAALALPPNLARALQVQTMCVDLRSDHGVGHML